MMCCWTVEFVRIALSAATFWQLKRGSTIMPRRSAHDVTSGSSTPIDPPEGVQLK